MKTTILVVGKTQQPDADWGAEYIKRMKGTVTVKEVTAPKNLPPLETQKAEAERLLKLIPSRACIVLLDERGKNLTSRDFAAKIRTWQERGIPELVFLIGGADGVTDEVHKRAEFVLSFGQLTWPHRMARVMLLEQLYRAQQINIGHPYHRD